MDLSVDNMENLNKLFDQAISLGYTGPKAEEFVNRQIAAQEERDERALNRAATRERELEELEKERLAKQVELEREKRETELRLEKERLEKQLEWERKKLEFEKEKLAAEREERERELLVEKERQKHELEILRLKSTPEYKPDGGSSNFKSSLPKIPPFDENVDEIDMYIDRFERLAKFHKWEEDQYASLLGSLLRGKALKVYCNLSSDIVDNFDELKSALLKAFKVNANVYRKRFREESILTDESFVQLRCRLGQYFDKWVELSSVEHNFEDLRDLMIRDQLLSSCSHDLRVFLLEQSFGNSSDLAEGADRYLVAHGIKKCLKSKSKTTVSKASSQSTVKPSSNTLDVTCHHCGEKGHIRPNCPVLSKTKKKTDNKAVPKIAVVLDREEKLRDCVSDSEGKIFDTKVEVVFDTGCNTVVIRDSLIPSDYCLGKKVKVFDYLGRPIYLKTICCYLESKFYSGKVKAIVAPIKCTDVIVGLIPGLKNNVNLGLDMINSTEEKDVNINVVTRSQAAKANLPVIPLSSNVDSLTNTAGLNPVDFAYHQSICSTLKDIRKRVEDESILSLRNRKVSYVKIGELIYRKCVDSSNVADIDKLQLIVPLQYRKLVMKLAHESLLAGHFSSRKTTDKIFQEFYWPRASLDIHNFCKSCHACQKFTVKPKKVPLVSMPVITEPFSRVAIDIVGPITPASKRGHRYILTLIDMATRYPEAVPLRNIDTVSIAEALVEIFCRVGVPREILSDCGTQFKSDLMSEIHKLLSVKALYTSPYHAACNGMVERLNGTLKNMLKKTCMDQPEEWDRYINIVLFAYREIPNDTLKFSPFELLYGRNVRGPLAILHELVSNNTIDADLKLNYQYVIDLRDKLQETTQTALDNANISAKKYKEYFDRKTKSRKFKVNDEVLIMLPTSTNKFVMQWKGPYIISDLHANGVDYYIKVGNKIKLFHVNMLKPYVRRVNIIHENQTPNHSSDLFDNIEPISDLSPDEVHDEFDLQLLGHNNSTDAHVNQNLTLTK